MTDPIGGLPRGSDLYAQSRGDSLESKLENADSAEAAKEMEALLATMLVKELRSALPEGFFGKGPGADTYEGWLDEHLGRAIADSGSLDLAGRIKASLDSRRAAAAEAGSADTAPEAEPKADPEVQR